MEQEFFEAFGINKIDGHNCIPYNTIKNECEYIINGFTDSCSNCEHLEKHYPPITPEIVLKLEEILLNTFQNFKYKTGIENNTYSNGIKGVIGCFCSNKIPFKGNNYFLGRADSYEWAGIGDNRLDALLNLCIQLKDEIQDQVRELFND